MEGLVFDCFDPIRHVIEPFRIPGDWPRFRAVDFGYRNPFVCLWFALSPEDEMVVYRQWYMSRRTTREHSEKINEIERVYKSDRTGKKRAFRERIESCWADHDADGRATLEENGIDTDPAEKAVSTGIQELYDRIADNRFFIFRDSLVEVDERMKHLGRPTSLQEELQGYASARSKTGQPDKENPIKINDHATDAARYGSMGLKDWSASAPIEVI
jgi:phage terminase large subunit